MGVEVKISIPKKNLEEFKCRYINITAARQFAPNRFEIFDENNKKVIDSRNGWTGNYLAGDANKDMERELNYDLKKNVYITRMIIHHQNHGSHGRYYYANSGGAKIVLKDKNGDPIATQFVEGERNLNNRGPTDLRYKLSGPEPDYNKEAEEVNKAAKESEAEVEKEKQKTKAETEALQKNSEVATKKSQVAAKCASTGRMYEMKLQALTVYCTNLGVNAGAIDAQCKNLTQEKAEECFTNSKIDNLSNYKCRPFYSFEKNAVNFVIIGLIIILFLKWYKSGSRINPGLITPAVRIIKLNL